MQTELNFSTPHADSPAELSALPGTDAKAYLIYMINTLGMSEFKEFYLKVKYGQITYVPDGYTKDMYLMLCKEVYEGQAQRISRTKIKRR